MPGSEERPPADTLTASIADPAVALDAAGRVIAWNEAAAARALIPAGAAGRALAEVIPAPHIAEATRLDLTDGGAILTWPGPRPLGESDVAREKARVVEHIAPGVAHDLINQVGGIQGFLQVLEDGDARDRELLAANADRAMDTVKAFQRLVTSRLAGPATMPAAGLIAEALALCAYPLQEVAVTLDVPETLPEVEGEIAHLRLALLAVLVSSLDALGWPLARGSLRVTARATDRRVEIAIEDDGTAIPGDAAEELFEAPTGSVAGRDSLDLAVARHLLRLESGDCSYAPRPGGGNRFLLAVPSGGAEPDLRGPAGAADAAGTEAEAAPPPRTAVLVCDDEESVRSLVVRVLGRAGLDTAEASSGPAALAVIATGRVSVVVADHHLGSMTGLQLYTQALTVDPELRGRFILMSGDAGDAGLVDFATAHDLQVVAKPFLDLGQLPALVRRLEPG